MSKKKPSVPSYSQDPQAKELQNQLYAKSTGLLNMPYGEWYQRFNVPKSPLTTGAVSSMTDLTAKQGYTPTTYEDFLKQISPDQALTSGALGKYQRLLDTQDYSMTDYKKTEQDYLDTVLRQYNKARGEAWKPVQENLIAENLFSSGPGIGKQAEFGKETAQGVGDITKAWAYEGIQREQTQKQYMDALKRGDYTTMYNLALQDEQKKYTMQANATQLAEIEKEYYNALQRGDIETAFNMGQILRQNEIATRTAATGAEFNAINPASNLYGQLTQKDLALYQAALQAYNSQMAKRGSLSGLGSLAGMGLMGGLSLLIPGTGIGLGSLTGAQATMLGGGAGGALGSMFD